MNGLEALQAMKDGKIVRYIRSKDGQKTFRDSFFCYRTKYIGNETNQKIWVRMADWWTWEPSDNPPEFWMKADGFEIEEEEK